MTQFVNNRYVLHTQIWAKKDEGMGTTESNKQHTLYTQITCFRNRSCFLHFYAYSIEINYIKHEHRPPFNPLHKPDPNARPKRHLMTIWLKNIYTTYQHIITKHYQQFLSLYAPYLLRLPWQPCSSCINSRNSVKNDSNLLLCNGKTCYKKQTKLPKQQIFIYLDDNCNSDPSTHLIACEIRIRKHFLEARPRRQDRKKSQNR